MNRFETVAQILDRRGFALAMPNEELENSIVNYKNNANVTFILPCGHLKTVKASYLPKMGNVECGDCELFEKYGYDSNEGTLTCKNCDKKSFEVPRTNLGKYVCMHCCEHVNPEVKFFRLFNRVIGDRGYITRNCQYVSNNRKALTADFKIVYGDKEALVEIDDASHLSVVGAQRHLRKQELAKQMGVPLLRIHSPDVEKLNHWCILHLLDGLFERYGEHDVYFYVGPYGKDFYKHPRLQNEFQDTGMNNREFNMWHLKRDDEITDEDIEEDIEEERINTEEWVEKTDEKFVDDLFELRFDIVNRVEDLKAFYEEIKDNEEDERLKILDTLFRIWDNLATLILGAPSDELIAAIKDFLEKATAFLLFSGRKLTLEDNQSVEERDVPRENALPLE